MISHTDVSGAAAHLVNLSNNKYPGRGIVAGLDQSGTYLVQVYWIMGRSENSRNRVFSNEGGRVYTEAADAGKVKDPALIIYNAMCEVDPEYYIVSNGDQTDVFAKYIGARVSIGVPHEQCLYEPDAPNFTSRITAVCSRTYAPKIELFIHRKSLFGEGCDRMRYAYEQLEPGFGFHISTYAGDGDPLPAFRGDPLLMPLSGSMEEIAQAYWAALNEENRVSLVVKMIDMVNGTSLIRIINKYEKALAG